MLSADFEILSKMDQLEHPLARIAVSSFQLVAHCADIFRVCETKSGDMYVIMGNQSHFILIKNKAIKRWWTSTRVREFVSFIAARQKQPWSECHRKCWKSLLIQLERYASIKLVNMKK
jgi:hypothetical protein